MNPTPDLITTASSYGVHTLLLIAVFYLVKAVLYLNAKREAQEERFLDTTVEQVKILTQIHEVLENYKHE